MEKGFHIDTADGNIRGMFIKQPTCCDSVGKEEARSWARGENGLWCWHQAYTEWLACETLQGIVTGMLANNHVPIRKQRKNQKWGLAIKTHGLPPMTLFV